MSDIEIVALVAGCIFIVVGPLLLFGGYWWGHTRAKNRFLGRAKSIYDLPRKTVIRVAAHGGQGRILHEDHSGSITQYWYLVIEPHKYAWCLISSPNKLPEAFTIGHDGRINPLPPERR